MGMLEGKTALVTGASRGIGRAIALKLAAEGADVAFTYGKSAEMALSLSQEIESMGRRALPVSSDASDFEDAHRVVGLVADSFGRIDVLVNNAGLTRDGLLLRMTESQWDEVINVNLKSVFNYSHAVVPLMARQRGGSIISVSSVVGVHGNAGQCNYSASKAGIIGFTKSLAKEMGPRGIRVNCIAPGFILTDMTSSLADEIKDQYVKSIPMRRAGTPDDVADVAAFLAGSMSSYVSGQVIEVSGAM